MTENYRFAQIFIAGSNPAAYFAYKFSVLYKGLVFLWIAYLIAKVVQITKVFVVAGVRHTCLCHCFCLRKRVSNLTLIFGFVNYSKNQHNKKSNCGNIFNIPRHHPAMVSSISKCNACDNIIENYAA